MNMKHLRSLFFFLTLCLLLSACGGEEAPVAPAEVTPPEEKTATTESGIPLPDADTLVIAIPDEPEGLDVQQISYGNILQMLMAEPLIAYSADLTELNPSLAESFTLTDHYIEFVLPADAKFSNGNPLDAEAVKASTERFLEVSDYSGDLDTISDIEVIDERTVRYNLSEPAPYSLATIASLFCGIVDVKECERVGEWEFNRHPVMCGAYTAEEWVPRSYITLRRNEYFRTSNPEVENHGPANFERVVFRFVADGAERLRLLDAGEIDIAFNAPTNDWERLKADGAYTVYSYQQPGVCYLNLQTGKGPLRDIIVRQALTYAVDRDALNEALGGVVVPSYGFLAAPQTGFSPEEEAALREKLAYDPVRARELLAEAGWRDTDGDGIVEKAGKKLSFGMMLPSDRSNLKLVAPLLVEQFAAVGAEAEWSLMEEDYIKELMRSDEYDVGSRAYEWNDADILYWSFTGDAGYQWDDPELTELLTRARHTNDLTARVEVYAEAAERLAEDYKAISLFSDEYLIVTKSTTHGLKIGYDDRAWVNDVTKD